MSTIKQIHGWIEALRTNPSEDVIHSLIEAGGDAIPFIVTALRNENDPAVRNRFLEVLSETPTKELAPVFEEKLSSIDANEVRFSVLGLLKLDFQKYASRVLKAIQDHPILAKEKQLTDYVLDSVNAANRRGLNRKSQP